MVPFESWQNRIDSGVQMSGDPFHHQAVWIQRVQAQNHRP